MGSFSDCNNAFSVILFILLNSPAVTNVTHAFTRHERHYLNVSKIGMLAVNDAFDCTFECLRRPLCVSVNLAASAGADGKLWCEALSSDKYRNSLEFRGNDSSHHFSIKVRSYFHIIRLI